MLSDLVQCFLIFLYRFPKISGVIFHGKSVLSVHQLWCDLSCFWVPSPAARAANWGHGRWKLWLTCRRGQMHHAHSQVFFDLVTGQLATRFERCRYLWMGAFVVWDDYTGMKFPTRISGAGAVSSYIPFSSAQPSGEGFLPSFVHIQRWDGEMTAMGIPNHRNNLRHLNSNDWMKNDEHYFGLTDNAEEDNSVFLRFQCLRTCSDSVPPLPGACACVYIYIYVCVV